nr:phenylalanine--tRNA ligase subunit beta [Geodermatophilaceae bacterium]
VQDTAGCPRYVAAVVEGLDPGAATPAWLARRLTVAGIRTVSLAVDVTNYVMLELGQPLHAFDRDRLTGPIVVRRATAGERLQTLDGVVRDVHAEDLLITDDSGPIGLAAVMGGLSTEVTTTTTAVLLEGAYWDPATVGRSARRHRLPSEASKRFERGTDPALPSVSVARAASLLAEYGGGRVVPGSTDVDHRVERPAVRLPVDLPTRVVGVDYDRATVVDALEAVGCTVTPDDGGDVLTVQPPSWRPDLVDPNDLVEEVVRREGYDAVPSVLPVLPAGSGLGAAQRRRRSVGRALAEAGYVETPTYPFIAPSAFDTLGLPGDDPRRHAVRVANPLSDAEPLMRTTLLPGLLRTLGRNRGRGAREVAVYELGVVVQPSGQETGAPLLPVDRRPDPAEIQRLYDAVPAQPWHAGVVLSGDRAPAGWWGDGTPLSWADAVQAGRVVADAAGVGVEVRAAQHAPWHPGRCAAFVLAGTDTVLGYAGELHPGVLARLDLPTRVCAMELDLSALPEAGVAGAPDLSGYPAALVDVALVVAQDVPAAKVAAALASGELVEAVRLFDVYAGAQVPAGHRSLAYALTLRAGDRTLTTDDVTAARDAAVAAATERTGAALRA